MERYFHFFLSKWNMEGNGMEWNGTPFRRPMGAGGVKIGANSAPKLVVTLNWLTKLRFTTKGRIVVSRLNFVLYS